MGNTAKIAAGLGILAGISYFGKRRMDSHRLAAKAGAILGFFKGFGRGFGRGVGSTLQSIFRIRRRALFS